MRVAVIGAGPAGISASLALIARNVHVTMLDEQPSAGGQIFFNSYFASFCLVRNRGKRGFLVY